MEGDPVIAAAVQKGSEAHLRRQRRMKADLLDMGLPLPIYEAVRHQDLDLLAAFIAHPLFERIDFQPHLMDLALPSRNREVIELIRARVEPYASFDRQLFDAILDRDSEAIANFDRDLYPEDYWLALEIEKTYRQALSTLPNHPNTLDYDVSRYLPDFALNTAVQAHDQPQTFVDQSGIANDEEITFFLQHLAQRYGIIRYETLKRILFQAFPSSLNPAMPFNARSRSRSEAADLHPQASRCLELSLILIGYLGNLQAFADLLPECLAIELETWGNNNVNALPSFFSWGFSTLLESGANANGLTKLRTSRYGTRKYTALDVVNFYQCPAPDELRQAGGKRAHDLRREAQPEIEAMLADLNLT